MAAVEMPRGKLIGVRLSAEEVERLDRLAAHFERNSPPGVTYNAQTTIKAAIAIAATQAGIDVPPAAPSRPRVKKTTRR